MDIDVSNWGDPRKLALALQQANDQLTALEAELESQRNYSRRLEEEIAKLKVKE